MQEPVTYSPTPAGRPNDVTLVDIHSHEYSDTYLAACRRDDSGLDWYWRDDGRQVVLQDGAVALAAPQPMPSADERLALMDAAGVDVQLLSVSAPNVFPFPDHLRAGLTRELNDELLELTSITDGRLRPLISLPLPDVHEALVEVDRVLDHHAVAGVFLCTTIHGRPLDHPDFLPLWKELSDREAAILVHPTVAACPDGTREFALALALGFMGELTNAIGRLVYSGTVARFPGIRWVFTHLGGSVPFVLHRFDNYYRQFPECREYIDEPPTSYLQRLHFDTVTLHEPAFTCAVQTFGAQQFLFGTDYPHVPGGLGPFVDLLEDMRLDERARRLIAADNARRLFAGIP